MKRTLLTLLLFAGAILFFACVTGIASEVQANGFNWPKIVEIAKGEDNMYWSIVPIGCIIVLTGYWIFNRD